MTGLILFLFATLPGQLTLSGLEVQRDVGVLKGVVYDAGFGLPLEQAITTVERADGSSRKTISGSDGGYEFRALAPGKYRASVGLRGFIPYAVEVVIAPGETRTLDVPLVIGHYTDVQGTEITGSVRHVDGKPGAGVDVVAIRATDGIRVQSRTDEIGNYRVSVKDPGQYVVLAFKPGFAIAIASVIIQPSAAHKGYKQDFVISRFSLR